MTMTAEVKAERREARKAEKQRLLRLEHIAAIKAQKPVKSMTIDIEMKTSYKNSFWKAGENNPYSKETLIHDTATGGRPEEYKGYMIYPRWDRFALCYDIVKDGVCVSQYAGPNGARGAIDNLIKERAGR